MTALDVVVWIALKGTLFCYELMFDYDWLVFVHIDDTKEPCVALG